MHMSTSLRLLTPEVRETIHLGLADHSYFLRARLYWPGLDGMGRLVHLVWSEITPDRGVVWGCSCERPECPFVANIWGTVTFHMRLLCPDPGDRWWYADYYLRELWKTFARPHWQTFMGTYREAAARMEALQAAGYREVTPWEGDRESAREWVCEACGHMGLQVRSWARGESRVALAVCGLCGHGEEF